MKRKRQYGKKLDFIRKYYIGTGNDYYVIDEVRLVGRRFYFYVTYKMGVNYMGLYAQRTINEFLWKWLNIPISDIQFHGVKQFYDMRDEKKRTIPVTL